MDWFNNKKSLAVAVIIAILLSTILASCRSAPPTPTATPVPTPTRVVSPTATPVPSASPTPVPAPTAVVSATPTATPTRPPAPTATATPAAKPSGTLTVAVGSLGAETPIPWMGGASEAITYTPIYEPLLLRDPKTGEFAPGLAEKWELSTDHLAYTFYLRKGVQFQDGYGELTADDVKFTIEQYMKQSSTSIYAGQWRGWIKSIEIVNPYQVVLHLNNPAIDLLEYVVNPVPRFGVASRKYVEKVGEKAAIDHPVGSGPWKFVEHKVGDYYKYEAVEGHWRQTPAFQYLILKGVPEDATRVAMLKTGEADITDLPLNLAPEVKQAGLRIKSVPYAMSNYLHLGGMVLSTRNTYDPTVSWFLPKEPQRALKVRQAMALAIDRQSIVDKVLLGQGDPTMAVPSFVPGKPWFDPALKAPGYDPQKAKQLLADAGYPNGFELEMRVVNYPGRPDMVSVAQAVAPMWEAIGLKVKLRPIDWGAERPDLIARKTAWTTWSYSVPALSEPALERSAVWSSKAGNNMLAEDATIDDIFNKASQEFDSAKRYDLSRQLGKYISDNVLDIPVAYVNALFGISNKVGDWQLGVGHNYVINLEYVTHAK